MLRTRWYALVIWLIAMTVWVPQALAQSRHFVVDLTHPIPTFQQGDVGGSHCAYPPAFRGPASLLPALWDRGP